MEESASRPLIRRLPRIFLISDWGTEQKPFQVVAPRVRFVQTILTVLDNSFEFLYKMINFGRLDLSFSWTYSIEIYSTSDNVRHYFNFNIQFLSTFSNREFRSSKDLTKIMISLWSHPKNFGAQVCKLLVTEQTNSLQVFFTTTTIENKYSSIFQWW